MRSDLAGGEPWNEIQRRTLQCTLDDMTDLTVVATLPGWGASTWMRQWRACLEKHDGARTHAARSRSGARKALLPESLEGIDALFIDEVALTVDDDLWDDIAAAARSGTKVVTWSLDCPVRPPGLETRVYTEAEIALSAEEIAELAELNDINAPPGLISTLSTRYRGNPALTRVRLRRLAAAGARASLLNPDDRLDIHLASEVYAASQGHLESAWKRSAMATVLDHAAMMRRVSPATLGALVGNEIDVSSHHRRLLSLPFGTVEADESGGGFALRWSDPVWEHLEIHKGRDQRDSERRRVAAAARATGERTLELFCQTELGDVEAAEELARDEFRYFLFTMNDTLARALASVDWAALKQAPSLLMLLGEHRGRAFTSAGDARRYFAAALEALKAQRPVTAFEHLRRAGRYAYASTAMGDRQGALRWLSAVEDLLDGDSDGSVTDAAVTDPFVVRHLAAELHLSFWVATQLDRHDFALRLTDLIAAYFNPRSSTAVAERNAILTQRVLAGTDQVGQEALTRANTEPLLLLEQGRDNEALDLLRLLEERVDVSSTRSGAEALLVLIHSFADRTEGTKMLVTPEDALERSRAHWSDGVASTAVTAAAAAALLARGDNRGALDLAQAHPRRDWFILLGEAASLLAADRAGDAVPVIQSLRDASGMPRARTVASALDASAHLHLGRPQAALACLEAAIAETGSGAVRLALRLVPYADVEALAGETGDSSDALRTALEQSLRDPHPIVRTAAVRLTPVDRENLTLLREGATNAEIAKRRYVSLNTVRTQVRLLLRKLGASDRHDAVVRADALGYRE